MDWIKVKVKHFEYDFADASDSVYKLWISSMIYTAAIEKMPTNEQLDRRLGKEGHKNLKKYLQKIGIKLEEILVKVLEDVQDVQAHRKHNRKYMSKYRSNPLHNPLRGSPVGGRDKIREDKIREDKIREEGSFDPRVYKLIKETLKNKTVT